MKQGLPILVTGADGFTGKFLCLELKKKGILFKASLRPGKDKSWFDKKKINVVYADIYNKYELTRVLRECKALINIASIGFGAAPIIIQSCKEAKVERVLFVSSTSIFTKLNAKSKIIRLNAEKAISQSKLKWTIIRPTMIYGNENDRNMIRLIKFIDKFPFIPIFGNGQFLQQPVHVRDLAWAISEIIFNKKSEFKSFNIAGQKPQSFNEIIDTISFYLNKKIKRFYVPKNPVIFILKILELIKIRLPIKAEQIQRLNENKNFSYKALTEIIKYKPLSFEEGIKEEIYLYKNKILKN